MPPEQDELSRHSKPFVHETAKQKALHFSMLEIQSSMWVAKPNDLKLQYTRIMMGFLMFDPQPTRIAMVGLGGGSLVKFCHRYLPTSAIDVIEINPDVIALRDQFVVPPDDERLRVIEGDGAWYVKRGFNGPVDVLMVDGFASNGLPGPLCSQRFYEHCLRALTPTGTLVVNLHNGKPNFGVQAERIRRTFGDSIEVGEDTVGNCIVFASPAGLPKHERQVGLRRPEGLEIDAWTQLRPAFARVARALVRGG
jgi:spermidine synthase